MYIRYNFLELFFFSLGKIPSQLLINRPMSKLTNFLPLFILAQVVTANSEFSWIDTKGTHIDLLYGDQKIARYVYEQMKPEDRERTYKPFFHLYDKKGESFVTKGPGGKFTHHRGIYYGFSKCAALDGNGNKVSVDTWHCKRGYQTHEKVLQQNANRKHASIESEIAWRVDDGTIFITEKRKLLFQFDQEGRLQIDFSSILSTTQPQVTLDGDPQHAGFQFRASNEVAESTARQTFYIRPKDGKDEMGKTKNWPQNKDMTNLTWKAQSVVVGGERYYTLYLDHPQNPKPSFYSERDYGRFGSYFKSAVTPKNPLSVKYRLIFGNKLLSPERCQQYSKDFSS